MPEPTPFQPQPSQRPDALRLFDCLIPFFTDVAPVTERSSTINWSKLPFASLENGDDLDHQRLEAIFPEFEHYLASMAAAGYNAVAIDDLAHLVVHDCYPAPLKAKLRAYRRLYSRIFAACKAHRLSIFVISDYLSTNPAIEAHLATSGQTPAEFFDQTMRSAIATHPQIDGLVLRIGERDGVDVSGDFASNLTIREATEARALLQRLLPFFESHGKTLVFRTWTLGAYPVGDLIWNQRTYDAVFGEIDSPHLVVSLKYGDADFFRYLALNPLVFHGPQRKIIEFQCRREYEGMGEFPSFVGWLYARYLADLNRRPNRVIGCFAVNAGGWAPFSKGAYCPNGSIWNELNTETTIALVRQEGSVEDIVVRFCQRRGIADVAAFLRLLSLSDQAIEEGLYIREFAEAPRYFRRVRVPPLVWIFWNNVTAGGLIADLCRLLVHDRQGAVAEGRRAVQTVQRMRQLARASSLPDEGLDFQLATFEILAGLRTVLFGLDSPEDRTRLEAALTVYRRRYPGGYRVDPLPSGDPAPGRLAALLLPLLIRNRRSYRGGDRLLLSTQSGWLRTLISRRAGTRLPTFLDRLGMSSDTLLR